jgi:NTP pyrophosphatase (non-canonical NTP hydrolase)
MVITFMNDTQVTLQQLKEKMATFVRERDWNQFHVPKNLSMALAVEASELMELFLWAETNGSWDVLRANREKVEQELADVLSYTLAFANACDIDLTDAFVRKLAHNAQKYPVEKAKGKSDKYHSYT